MLIKLVLALVVAVIGFAVYVRVAPSDPARWHVAPPDEPARFDRGIVEVIEGNAAALAALDAIARATPRTRVLAGSADEGRITYVTRSRLWGFPDYTTVELRDDRIVLFARLRFGGSDMGVNAARVADWLQRLQAIEE